MKALLMHRDRDFDLQQAAPPQAPELIQDLAIDTLLQAMAGDDVLALDVARTALLSGMANDGDTIRYRQGVLQDCIRHPAAVKDLYAVATEAVERKAGYRRLGITSRYPGGVLHDGLEFMAFLLSALRKLKSIAEEHASRFESAGFRALFARIGTELDDAYLASIERNLSTLQFRNGVLISAMLGEGNAGTDYVLLRPADNRRPWLARVFARSGHSYTVHVDPRDEAGARALAEMRDRGINLVANALAQSADHVESFFQVLRAELAFYIGCMNLHDSLAALDEPMCYPDPHASGSAVRRFRGLYDVCLALTSGQPVVGNTLDADGRNPIIVTGANQGGKSTFLRSVGLAQLMMQCGMFVGAEAFAAALTPGLFTHYWREEDATMVRGKFDEELQRLSDIADRITPNAMLLFNESFASTNEREGSAIAGQIVRAMLEGGASIVYVTHLHQLARSLYEQGPRNALFLRAERQDDGTRTFVLTEGEPLETSFGEDLYREVFTIDADAARGAVSMEVGCAGPA